MTKLLLLTTCLLAATVSASGSSAMGEQTSDTPTIVWSPPRVGEGRRFRILVRHEGPSLPVGRHSR